MLNNELISCFPKRKAFTIPTVNEFFVHKSNYFANEPNAPGPRL